MIEEIVGKQNNVKVEYQDDFPSEVLDTIKESVAFVVPILPRWCSHLYVSWYGDNECELRIKISVKNRWAALQFHAGFFNRTEGDRKIGLIHEVIHIYLEPMSNVFHAAVDKDNKTVDELWVNAVERTTQDLALAWAEISPSEASSP